MNNILCSIIIPYYNVPEELVNKCLLSIYNQNWGEHCYEVIFVNDGSPLPISNSTKEIFSKFQFFTIIEQDNQGPGNARNNGISRAKGDYLFFIDPDDYWIQNSIENLFPYLQGSKYDLIKFTTLNSNPRQTHEYNICCSGVEYMSKHNILNGVCSYCFRTKFIKDNGIVMPNILNIEDKIFLYYAFYYAKTYIQTNINLYYYYYREHSLTKHSNQEAWNRVLNNSLAGIKLITRFRENEIKYNHLTEIQLTAHNTAYYTIVIDHIYQIFKGSYSKINREAHLSKLKETVPFPLPKIKHSLKYTIFRIASSNYYFMLMLCKSIHIAYAFLRKRY